MNAIRRNGFSLLELMIGIGILAIGGAMIASVFLAAGVENKKSIEHTMGALVSENALAICRNKLRHSVLNNRVAVEKDKYTNVTGHITLAEAAYPMARLESEVIIDIFDHLDGAERDAAIARERARIKAEDWVTVKGRDYPSARYGWMVGARQLKPDTNDYELSIVVYQKFLPNDRPGYEIQLDASCKKANYVPEIPAENPNPRDPTILCWITRTALRP